MQPKVATKPTMGKNLTSPRITRQSKTATATKNCQSTTTPPNVPTKEKASIFNRKHRELLNGQLTPMTPKIDKSRGTTQRGRRSRTGEARKSTSPSGTGRSKKNQNYYLDSEYTTPRTTRTSLTPASFRNGRIVFDRNPQLIYGPLGLDNESSSESSDMMIRTKILRMSQETRRPSTPLAIEAPKEVEVIEIDVTPCDPQPSKQQSPSSKPEVPRQDGKLSSPERKETTVAQPQNQTPTGATKSLSQTPPLTPIQKPKTLIAKTPSPVKEGDRKCLSPKQTLREEETDATKQDQTPNQLVTQPTFVPGSCNINDILKYYGARSKNNASSKSNVKAGN